MEWEPSLHRSLKEVAGATHRTFQPRSLHRLLQLRIAGTRAARRKEVARELCCLEDLFPRVWELQFECRFRKNTLSRKTTFWRTSRPGTNLRTRVTRESSQTSSSSSLSIRASRSLALEAKQWNYPQSTSRCRMTSETTQLRHSVSHSKINTLEMSLRSSTEIFLRTWKSQLGKWTARALFWGRGLSYIRRDPWQH